MKGKTFKDTVQAMLWKYGPPTDRRRLIARFYQNNGLRLSLCARKVREFMILCQIDK